MAYRLDVYDDFHVHGASAPEWNQRYWQLSPGAMRSTLVEATAGDVHVFRKWMSERVVQQGCLPAGKVCFVMLGESGVATPRLQGQELRDDRLVVLRGGDEFMLQRPPGTAVLAVTFEAEAFGRLLDARPWSPAMRGLLARPALQAPPRSVQRLRRLLWSVVAARTGTARDAAADPLVTPAIFETMCDVYAGAAAARQPFASASASYVVAECHRIVAAGGDAPPSIEALALRLRTSRRSLQSSFRLVAGTTPVEYLRGLRLNAVRRRLMATPAAELAIAQAASDQGFAHLSHFSARYRALFGELPSQTWRPERGTGSGPAAV